MRKLTGVVLGAGNATRMSGKLLLPTHEPDNLVVIETGIRRLLELKEVDDIVVVESTNRILEKVLAMRKQVNVDYLHFMVQPSAISVIDALQRVIGAYLDTDLLIMFGDCVYGDLRFVKLEDREIPFVTVEKFANLLPYDNDYDILNENGKNWSRDCKIAKQGDVFLGCLYLPSDCCGHILKMSNGVSVSQVLNMFCTSQNTLVDLREVFAFCYDVGTPERYAFYLDKNSPCV